MNYFKVKVQFEVDNGKRVRNVNRLYVVNAVSPTEAEAKMTDYLKNSTEPFEVKDCVSTKFEDYID